MKTESLVSLALAAAVLTLTGCNNSNPPAAPEASPATNAAAAAAPAAPATPTEAVTAATNAVATMAPAATNAAVAATSDFDSIIAQIKQYIADKKYSDASASLANLSTTSLTSDQQKTVDDLKTQVQQQMAGAAADSAAKNLLGK